MRVTGWILGLMAVALAAPSVQAAPKADARVTLTRGKDGAWIADYVFSRASPVWFFERSATDLSGKPWRPQSWTVETPGVRMERAGRYDVVTAGGAPLRRVRFRIKPFSGPLRADYTPALSFSDGALAFYSGQFRVVPIASLADAAALPNDLEGVRLEQVAVTMTVSDPRGPLLWRGVTNVGRVRFTVEDDGAYIYAGKAPVIATPAFAGVIDPGLPEWVRGELDRFTPQVMKLYTDRMGAPLGGRPMALIAWGGGGRPGASLGGSVLQGMVVMQISGKVVANPTPTQGILDHIRWFIGHESAHFWIGQTIRYQNRSESWIAEGSADVAAVRAIQQLSPGYDAKAALQREVDECLKLNGAGEPLSTAEERGENRASYGCGAMLLLAVESAEKHRDPAADAFTFLRALVDANRADRVVTRDDWLLQFEKVTGDPALAADVRGFIKKGVADVPGFWARLFTATGVGFTRDGDAIRLR